MILNIAVTIVLPMLLGWMIWKANAFFLPYEEFAVTVKCNGDELKNGLKKHCPSTFLYATWKNHGNFYRKSGRNGIVILEPQRITRNTAGGKFHLSVKDIDETNCLAEAAVKPDDMRFFSAVRLTSATFFIITGVWFPDWPILLALIACPAFFFVLNCCRAQAADKIAGFKARFLALLRTIAEEAKS